MGSVLGKLGSHPVGLWVIKHLVSPLDRLVVAVSGGKLRPPSTMVVPSLLLTVRVGTEIVSGTSVVPTSSVLASVISKPLSAVRCRDAPTTTSA